MTALPDAPASSQIAAAPPRLSDGELGELLKEHYGIEGSLTPLTGERDQNIRVDCADRAYVLKIANHAEIETELVMQTAAIQHISAVDPGLPVPSIIHTLGGEAVLSIDGPAGPVWARLLTHLPGTPALGYRATPLFRRRLGSIAARLDTALASFDHQNSLDCRIWNLDYAVDLADWTRYIAGPDSQRMADLALARFEAHVAPRLPELRRQLIHNDLNQNNLLRGRHTAEITGVIDFGDMSISSRVNELAIAIAHQLYRQVDVLACAEELVEGHSAVARLDETEVTVLFPLVQMRLASREIIAAWRGVTNRSASAYRSDISRWGWEALARCQTIPPEYAIERIAAANAAEAPGAATVDTGGDPDYATLMTRRAAALGPLYKQFYRKPFLPVRGKGVWITDQRGKRYLDCYNNVPHVGHCNSHVVREISRQASIFISNTRYPSELVVEYAERIAATMPPPLDCCMFVCTGTEANELAWRIAKANTGGTGAVVTESAFHGNSTVIGAMDTATLPPARRENWISTVPAPAFAARRQDRTPPDAQAFVAEFRRANEDLAHRGHAPAAFFVCPIFASDGIYTVPAGFLDAALAEIREAGGLVIADETQTALGRCGTDFWGFQHAGIVPDIVTMAKPVGNGLPLAVLVTSRELLEGFARRERYFNTFGGNQLAAAGGSAVLDVLVEQELQQNADRVGRHIREGIAALMDHHASIGDVRGTGLFNGVEIVTNRTDDEPAPKQARAIIETLLDKGVLVGITGAHGNVLKIRPPMVITEAEADVLIAALDATLADPTVTDR